MKVRHPIRPPRRERQSPVADEYAFGPPATPAAQPAFIDAASQVGSHRPSASRLITHRSTGATPGISAFITGGADTSVVQPLRLPRRRLFPQDYDAVQPVTATAATINWGWDGASALPSRPTAKLLPPGDSWPAQVPTAATPVTGQWIETCWSTLLLPNRRVIPAPFTGYTPPASAFIVGGSDTRLHLPLLRRPWRLIAPGDSYVPQIITSTPATTPAWGWETHRPFAATPPKPLLFSPQYTGAILVVATPSWWDERSPVLLRRLRPTIVRPSQAGVFLINTTPVTPAQWLENWTGRGMFLRARPQWSILQLEAFVSQEPIINPAVSTLMIRLIDESWSQSRITSESWSQSEITDEGYIA